MRGGARDDLGDIWKIGLSVFKLGRLSLGKGRAPTLQVRSLLPTANLEPTLSVIGSREHNDQRACDR